MYLPRIIPCLLLDSQRLFKTIKFKNPNYIGDPINAVRIFNELEVDELIILDIGASKNKRSPDFDYLSDVVSEAFMPVGIGGGIENIEDASRLINIGVEKVIINTAAVKSLKCIESIATKFGNQSVVLSIDIKKKLFGGYGIYQHSNNKILSIDIAQYIQNGIDAGAGEIFLNYVDNDGQQNGYNCDFLYNYSRQITVPIIISGGAGKLDDFKAAIHAGASACAAGSLFVYKGKHNAVMINYPGYEILKKLFNE